MLSNELRLLIVIDSSPFRYVISTFLFSPGLQVSTDIKSSKSSRYNKTGLTETRFLYSLFIFTLTIDYQVNLI